VKLQGDGTRLTCPPRRCTDSARPSDPSLAPHQFAPGFNGHGLGWCNSTVHPPDQSPLILGTARRFADGSISSTLGTSGRKSSRRLLRATSTTTAISNHEKIVLVRGIAVGRQKHVELPHGQSEQFPIPLAGPTHLGRGPGLVPCEFAFQGASEGTRQAGRARARSASLACSKAATA